MTCQFTTEGIHSLRVLRRPPRLTVTFRSQHTGSVHQLYVNGRLADWTDTTGARSFTLDEPPACELIVAAVAPSQRARDFSRLLPADAGGPSWVFEARVPRLCELGRDDRLELLDDHATGELDPVPAASAQAWPASVPRWAWGEDRFAGGGFGFDGSQAPGAGMGAFGAGGFGMDAGTIDLRVATPEPGEHTVVVRSAGDRGATADAQPQTFVASPPPQAPGSIGVVAYDPQSKTLTIQIEEA
ncbi:MAG: hypothetical protein ACP5HU_10990 [Phycisphaerae bacterium]